MIHYTAYGLHVASAFALSGLSPSDAAAEPEIRVGCRNLVPSGMPSAPTEVWHAPEEADDAQSSHFSAQVLHADSEAFYRLRYAGEGRFAAFVIHESGRWIWADGHEDAAKHWSTLIIQPLSLALRLRGALCLHGSSVVIDGQAVVFIGPKGAGKSTTVAALAAAGHPVLADEVSVAASRGEEILFYPAYPCLRLWPASAQAVGRAPHELPRIFEGAEKRHVELGATDAPSAWRLHDRAATPAVIYFLQPRRRQLSEPRFEGASVVMATAALAKNLHLPEVKLDEGRTRREGKLLTQLAASVPMRRLTAPHSLSGLPQLCEAICADARSVMASAQRSALRRLA